MQEVKNELKTSVVEAVRKLFGQGARVELMQPKQEEHGDYATPIAFHIAKKRNENALKVAEKIALQLKSSKLDFLGKIEVVKPGFINFWLSKDILIHQLLSNFSMPKRLGDTQKGKTIVVEFTDPNPFKEFHIGHLFSNAMGESLCRLLESQGGNVHRVCYQGDVGLHVAKSVWGIMQKFHVTDLNSQRDLIEKKLEDLETQELWKRAQFLGEAYILGAKAYEEDNNLRHQIISINKMIYQKDPAILRIYEKGRQWSLSYFETIYKRLGTSFERYYFESEVGSIGKSLVQKHLKDKVFAESEGAVIFEGKKYGLHNRVFINSLGLPTYEAKDLGLPEEKYKDFPYDLSLIITAEEQSGYFEVVLKVLSLINPSLARKTKHIAHGMVRFKQGKMSSRYGNILTGEWLLDQVKGLIRKKYPEIEEKTAEKVAVGAVKYAMLKSGTGKDIIFDFEESISLQGNTGSYLQYAYARTQSILRKGRPAQNIDIKKTREITSEEMMILRMLYRFEEMVEQASEGFSPNILATYLYELSSRFNMLYEKERVLGSESEDFRLALTKNVGNVLELGLYLLGIEAPEKL